MPRRSSRPPVDPKTPSSLYYAVGGDRRLLREARAEALAKVGEWLRNRRAQGYVQMSDEEYDVQCRYVAMLVYHACANVGISKVQQVATQEAEAAEAARTQPALYAVCPKCGRSGP